MTCDVKRCRQQFFLFFAAFGPRRKREVAVCQQHWERHCDEEDEFDLIVHFYPPKEA
jgi:hypothetical protein